MIGAGHMSDRFQAGALIIGNTAAGGARAITPFTMPFLADTRTEAGNGKIFSLPIAISAVRGEIHRLIDGHINKMKWPAGFMRTVGPDRWDIIARDDLR